MIMVIDKVSDPASNTLNSVPLRCAALRCGLDELAALTRSTVLLGWYRIRANLKTTNRHFYKK